jgi:L-ascorbate metabolism protein UlaG (beta-lactamase superfamily)
MRKSISSLTQAQSSQFTQAKQAYEKRRRWRGFWMSGLCLFGFFSCRALERPELSQYDHFRFKGPVKSTPIDANAGQASEIQQLKVTFLGTSTLYFNDGKTGILIDGFFTRPGNLLQMAFGSIQSDHALVKNYLDRLGIKTLAAIPVFHSHYDHALDSAEIARLTGATLIGSESTAEIARGANLPAAQMRVTQPYQSHQFGDFTITMIPSKHVPLPGLITMTGMMGDITAPLHQPASLFAFAEGETYAIHIAHPLGNSMLHSGAFYPGELTTLVPPSAADQKYPVDTLFQCTPGLQKLDPEVQAQYYQEIVVNTGVKRIVPVHWDDFTLSLDQPLLPLQRFAEDMEASMDFLSAASAQHGVDIGFLPTWQPHVLYEGLF